MDPRLLLLVMCVTLASVQGAIPRCCVSTSRFPLTVLQDVQKYDIQTRNGACEIDALVLHYKGKRFCAHPRAKKILQTMQKSKMGSRNSI